MEDKEHFTERSNFSCVLKGKAKYLEEIKEYIIKEYVNKGLIKLVKTDYDKKEMHIVTEPQWKKYQKLKNKNEDLIGYDIRNG